MDTSNIGWFVVKSFLTDSAKEIKHELEPAVLLGKTTKEGLAKAIKLSWRRRRDSNPRAACAALGFRDQPVMSTSVLLRESTVITKEGLQTGYYT